MPAFCQTARESLSAYVDGELAPDRAAEIADHLTTCPACSAEYQALLETVARLRSQLTRFAAPDVLRARIRAALAATPRESVAAEQIRPSARNHRRRVTRALGVAAAVFVGAALGAGGTLVAAGGGRNAAPVASEVLASHVRSLIPDHLTDVRSSDQHNVKPWFNGRLDYSPTVPRLDDQGYPLIGGRVDYVGGRPVAVVVYGRRQHMINVFSWPTGSGDAPLATRTMNGYNMISWRHGGSERWVVSDLNAAELRSFAALLQHVDSLSS